MYRDFKTFRKKYTFYFFYNKNEHPIRSLIKFLKYIKNYENPANVMENCDQQEQGQNNDNSSISFYLTNIQMYSS